MELRDGIVVIVVGASAGIGRATAKSLASMGASVALLARSEKGLERVAAEITAMGRRALPLVADVRNEAEIKEAFDTVVRTLGHPQVVVNSAAVGVTSPVIGGEVSDWRAMIDVNLIGMAVACREAVRCFDECVGGHIINILSTSAHRLTDEAGFYAVSKHAARALTDLLRIEVKRLGLPVRVSAISPGRVNTTLFGSMLENNEQLEPEEVSSLITTMVNASHLIQVDDLIVRSRRRPQ